MERIEGSVATSLGELRAIEQQRRADEQAAREAEIKARHDERERALRAAREAETAWMAAERDARIAAETARADAERKARLEIEAAEAAERARHLIALEERRFGEELALRREIVRRQRPRWMLAVTGVALSVAIGLGWVAASAGYKADAAQQERVRAEAAKAKAIDEAHDAQAAVEQLEHDLASMQGKVGQAIRVVEDAQADANRRAEQDRREAEHRKDLEAKQERQKRDQDRLRRERQAPIKISEDCLRNAVCN
jgi:hypothetical protein